jgi:hypothetical protein
MPAYINDDKRRDIRERALELAIETCAHYSTWNTLTVLSVAKKYEEFILDGTLKIEEDTS